MEEYIICEKCGKKYNSVSSLDKKHYPNIFGKICIRCGNFIEPEEMIEMPIIKDNKDRFRKDRLKIRKYLKGKEK